jgi:hypothetical protein
MGYHIRMKLSNPTSGPVTVTIPAGSVFEVVDPFSRVQNLMTAHPVSVSLSPGQVEVVEIDSWCLNQSFSPPSNTPMQPTPLRPNKPYSSQSDVWGDLGQRR